MPKRRRALVYFFVISVGSGMLQFVLGDYLSLLSRFSYEEARACISGSVFLLAYMLHRRFSFRDRKRVGVAVYANGTEDIRGIFDKIGTYPDFIHVDVVDDTFVALAPDAKTYRMEVIRAYWPAKEVHTHLMVKNPSTWFDDVLPYSDFVFIHAEIDEDVASGLDEIRRSGCGAGLCLSMETSVDFAQDLAGKFDALMLLTIPEPGRSGQKFDPDALAKIRRANDLRARGEFRICVDGGINDQNVGLLGVEDVVSGSYVLNGDSPRRQVMRLQTSNSYDET
jgi:ribulose-phosphate 3-epimerase